MKIPTTAEDLEKEILLCSDKAGDLRIRQLISVTKRVDHEIIVEGVIKVFEKKNRFDKSFRDQNIAGRILDEIKPKSNKDLTEVLQRILNSWNKSVEEIPFWLKFNYGLSELIEAFENSNFSELEQDKISTLKFWLGVKTKS